MPEKRPTIKPVETESDFDLEQWIETELYTQYDTQAKILSDLGILEHFPQEDVMGIVGIDGKKYPIPSKEAIADAIRKDPERYQTKIEQGFTVLNLVPFAKPLEQLAQVMREQIVKHHAVGKLLDVSGEPLDLNPDESFDVWEKLSEADVDGELVYYPQKFDETRHQGQTKQQILDDNRENPFNGWNIQLLEDLSDLPREGEGKTIHGRKQIEVNKSPDEYLRMLKRLKEQGITPEDWIIYFLQYLKQKNQVINDVGDLGEKGSSCWLVGVYHPASGDVPFAIWDRIERQALLGENDPRDQYQSAGLRSAVNINN